MALANIKPTQETTIGKSLPQIQPSDYKGVVVDIKDVPETSLITYTAGYAWACDYYSQVVNSGNDLKALDPSQSKVYQQYTKVVKLVIQVEDPLSETQDDVTKLMTVSGTGLIVSGIVPEAGDMFIASVGNGRTGLFVINKTDRKSYFTQSVFEIDYVLLDYVDKTIERVADLENKVIETLYYNELYNQFKTSQLLSEDEYITQKSLVQSLDFMIDYYFREFWAQGYQNIVLPKQSFPIYDAFMDKFLHKILDTTDNYHYMTKRVPFTNYDCGLQQYTILDVLINRQTSLIPKCKKYMGLASTAYFAGNALLLTIAYSGLAYVVYPVMKSINPGVLENDPMTYWGYSFDGPLANMASALTNECAGLPLSEHHLHNEVIVYNSTMVAGKPIPVTKPAYFQQAYIFSNDFYQKSGEYSLLETLVMAYLNKEPIDPKKLHLLTQDFTNWTLFDQYYYIPIIILLIKNVLKVM